MSTIIVQTPRIIIREFIPDEEELLLALYRDPEVTRHVTKRADEENKKRFAQALEDYKNGISLSRWGVFSADDDDFIGVSMLKPADSDPTRIELGYVFAKKHWGKGLATELAQALIKYGFEERGLTEICACISPENIASQNVLLKAGFQRDGNINWHDSDLPFFRIIR